MAFSTRARHEALGVSGISAMHKIQFKGRILPEAFEVTVRGSPGVTLENDLINLKSHMRFNIQNNLVTVDCEVSTLEKSALGHFLLRAQTVVESTINLMSLATGVVHSVVIEECHLPNGVVNYVTNEDRELSKLMTAIQSDVDVRKILEMCLVEPPLFLAIRDLIDAMKTSYTAETNCARAVETIRNFFIPEGGSRDNGWAPMRHALNASREYVVAITNLSRGPRHGDYYGTIAPKVRESAKRTWILMNRFLEYRKRDNQPLPLSEFPLLSD
jgi:hypothetical protein